MDAYLDAFKRYADFKGRTSRYGFWMFVLLNFIVSLFLGLIGHFFKPVAYLTQMYGLAVLIPEIAIGCRRLHDIDMRGWWQLFPLVNIVLFCRAGQQEDNRFGAPPQNEDD